MFILLLLGVALAGLAVSGIPAEAAAGLFFAGSAVYCFAVPLVWNFTALWVVAALPLFATGLIALVTSSLRDSPRARRGAALALSGSALTLVTLVVLAFFTSSPVFHARELASLIGPVKAEPFEQAVQRLDLSGGGESGTVINQADVRLVDETIAEREAQNLVGSNPDFGSSYTLGSMSLTRRRGRLTWVAPLEFNGLSPWLDSDGTPGYVWVDAHDARKSGLVTKASGKPLHLRCLESAWWSDNIERVSWEAAPFAGLTDYSLELAADGETPEFVVTVYEHAVGFDGDKPTGVLVVDPQTCAVRHYSEGSLPSWVNREKPDFQVKEQLDNWAAYRNGWWNQFWFGAGRGVLSVTPQLDLVPTTGAGATAWYAGLATSGNRNGTTGFMLIDSRGDKPPVYFELAGATEEAARMAILGKVSQMTGWSATQPILYNIGSRATYLSVLKDAAGNPKGVGLMPVDDRSVVVVEGDLQTALLKYSEALSQTRTGRLPPGGSEISLGGVVARISSAVQGGDTVYWMTFESRPGDQFTAGPGIRKDGQLALTKPGDTLRVTARKIDDYFVMDSLENQTLDRKAADRK